MRCLDLARFALLRMLLITAMSTMTKMTQPMP